MKRILSLFTVLLFVAGCGGGSGDSNVQANPDPVDPVEEVPMCSEIADGILDDRGAIRFDVICNEDGSVKEEKLQTEEDSPEPLFKIRCIKSDGKGYGWKAGLDYFKRACSGQFDLPVLSGIKETTSVDGFEVCPSPDELSKFVDTFEPANTFDVAPVLSFADSSTEYHKQLVRESVSFLNKALPDEYDITESGIDVEGSDGGALQVPVGEIYIQFFPEQTGVPVGLAVGRYVRIIGGAEHEIGNSSALRESYVLFIAHEIMHVLGFSGHIDLPTNSIMMEGDDIIRRFVRDRDWPKEEILSAVDVWGIRYFYEDATGDPEEWLEGRCN